MKKRASIQITALLTAILLCLPLLPQRAEAGIADLVKEHLEKEGISSDQSLSEMLDEYREKKENTSTAPASDPAEKQTGNTTKNTVSGKWSDEKFYRANRYTSPFEFYDTLYSCTGFTLDYEILEINEGDLFSGNFKYEVYVRLTDGSWKSVDTFWLDDYETTVNIRFDDPLSIDAVAVVCLKKGNFDYVHSLTVRNATCRQSVIPTDGAVSGYWSDESFTRSNRSSYPFIFYSDVSRCTGFTLNYEITEVSKGSLDGNFKFAVYVRNSSGKWKYVDEFKLEGDSISRNVTMDSMTIDAVAVLCLKSGEYNYSYNFTITDTKTR